MADMNWDYIAGVIDGECSFTIATENYYFHPRLSIAQNTSNVLEEMQCFFVAHKIKSSLYENISNSKGNIWYSLRIQNRKDLLEVCRFLKDKLFVKDRQLAVFYKFLQIKSGDKSRTDLHQRKIQIEKSQNYREEIMRLNQKRKAG